LHRRDISPALYTVGEDERVVPLVLPREHPLASEVAVGHAKLALSEYQAQKEALEKEIEEDVFVASCFAERRKDGSVSSYTTWAEGVSSLLPEADEIILGYGSENDRTHLRVPWGAFQELAGGCLTEVSGLNPRRYRTGDWPSEQTLSALRGRHEVG
jgi:hypothetical protein